MTLKETIGKLECEADCNPKCEYTWIVSTTGVVIASGKELALLKYLMQEDIVCQAENVFGKIRLSRPAQSDNNSGIVLITI